MKHLFRMLAVAAALSMAATACSGDNDAPGRAPAAPDDQADTGREPDDSILTVYSRDREIAEPLFEQFERDTGIEIRARWEARSNWPTRSSRTAPPRPPTCSTGRSATPSDR